MLDFKILQAEVLKSFLENLKERSRADVSLIQQDAINKLGSEISDNLEAKNDLFSVLKFEQQSKQETDRLEEPLSSEDQEGEGQKEQAQANLEGGTAEVKKPDSEEDDWQREYEEEIELTQKIVNLSRKIANLHISAVYEQKGHKYISGKDEHRFNVGPLIVKTEQQEYLVPQMHCVLSRGKKHEIMLLSQDLLKREEMKDYSQDEKELLMGEIAEE